MFVKEILGRKGHDVKRVGPHENLDVAAACMRLQQVGALVVTDDDGRLAGILSERDVVRAVVDYGPRALEMRVSDFMQRPNVVCAAEDTVAKVAKLMTLHRVRHVPVIDQGEVRGIISIGDVVKDRFEEMELERDTLRDIALSHRLAG